MTLGLKKAVWGRISCHLHTVGENQRYLLQRHPETPFVTAAVGFGFLLQGLHNKVFRLQLSQPGVLNLIAEILCSLSHLQSRKSVWQIPETVVKATESY